MLFIAAFASRLVLRMVLHDPVQSYAAGCARNLKQRELSALLFWFFPDFRVFLNGLICRGDARRPIVSADTRAGPALAGSPRHHEV